MPTTPVRADDAVSFASEDLPLLSVVTPCYNGARFLIETIEAVLAQDYPRLEHIILDDGSTDESAAIIDTYATRYPDRIRAWHHENMGQANTINRGFELARGELLSIVNCDDPVLPGLFTRMVAEMVAVPSLAGAYPDFLVIDEHGQTVVELHPPDYSLVEMVRLGENFLGPGVVFRKAVVDAVGGWSPDYPSTLDLEFWLRGALYGEYGHVPEVLAAWRSHKDAKTVRDCMTDEAIQERFRILDAFFARPNVPDDVRAVRDEAYRNLHVITAEIMTPLINAPGERFVIHDRYARLASGQPSIEAEIAVYQESLERSMAATEESQKVVHHLQEQLTAAVAAANHDVLQTGPGALEAEARALEAERQLAIVAASTSWRITKPLRWVKRAGASTVARFRSRR